mmetsp:Transcript_29810/g.80668  ORF Transcript_29810/g.80668 Transcript_29810/m.80668 type:complete len:270 (-) Transcript_29810:1178-1987(-)
MRLRGRGTHRARSTAVKHLPLKVPGVWLPLVRPRVGRRAPLEDRDVLVCRRTGDGDDRQGHGSCAVALLVHRRTCRGAGPLHVDRALQQASPADLAPPHAGLGAGQLVARGDRVAGAALADLVVHVIVAAHQRSERRTVHNLPVVARKQPAPRRAPVVEELPDAGIGTPVGERRKPTELPLVGVEGVVEAAPVRVREEVCGLVPNRDKARHLLEDREDASLCARAELPKVHDHPLVVLGPAVLRPEGRGPVRAVARHVVRRHRADGGDH